MHVNYERYALDDCFFHCLFCHFKDRKGCNGYSICYSNHGFDSVAYLCVFNSLFPLNVLLVFAIIVLAAYLLKVMTSLFLAVLSKEDLEWKEIVRL